MMSNKRKCAICGKWFKPNTHNQKTCSIECRKTLQQENVRRYYRRHKDRLNAKRREDYHNDPEKYLERERRWWKKYNANRKQHIDDIFNAYYEYLDDIDCQ